MVRSTKFHKLLNRDRVDDPIVNRVQGCHEARDNKDQLSPAEDYLSNSTNYRLHFTNSIRVKCPINTSSSLNTSFMTLFRYLKASISIYIILPIPILPINPHNSYNSHSIRITIHLCYARRKWRLHLSMFDGTLLLRLRRQKKKQSLTWLETKVTSTRVSISPP